MTIPEKASIPGQHNHGSGTFVGRDNYGPIEMVDPTTKKLLEKLTKQAPALGGLLEKALRDGVISRDAVYALERAAWSINEDVVYTLDRATRSINEDVAGSLNFAATRINADVAQRIEDAALTIDDAVRRIVNVEFASEIGKLDSISTALTRHVDRVENVVTPPLSEQTINLRAMGWVFVIGLLIGVSVATWAFTR